MRLLSNANIRTFMILSLSLHLCLAGLLFLSRPFSLMGKEEPVFFVELCHLNTDAGNAVVPLTVRDPASPRHQKVSPPAPPSVPQSVRTPSSSPPMVVNVPVEGGAKREGQEAPTRSTAPPHLTSPGGGEKGSSIGTGTSAGAAGAVTPIQIDAPHFVYRAAPTYPLMARRLGKEGKVVLALSIDQRGKLTAVEVLQGADYGFTEAAVEAVRKSTFAPARRDGREVPVKAFLTVYFRLE